MICFKFLLPVILAMHKMIISYLTKITWILSRFIRSFNYCIVWCNLHRILVLSKLKKILYNVTSVAVPDIYRHDQWLTKWSRYILSIAICIVGAKQKLYLGLPYTSPTLSKHQHQSWLWNKKCKHNEAQQENIKTHLCQTSVKRKI